MRSWPPLYPSYQETSITLDGKSNEVLPPAGSGNTSHAIRKPAYVVSGATDHIRSTSCVRHWSFSTSIEMRSCPPRVAATHTPTQEAPASDCCCSQLCHLRLQFNRERQRQHSRFSLREPSF
ncbi:hypothetical protein Hypma_011188 [Hypsizygus marmoreus]|uniref:Uncharacterized protein n=1 Tax=Hypsizygus marmoreus TaxID=39966 RepID=A0A369JMF7_HYPMA|nr:hypothetical protein Hypma_011188 [Hypsizygus marmoreus]